MNSQFDDEEIMRERRRRRIEEAKRRKRKQKMIRRLIRLLAPLVIGIIVLIILIIMGIRSCNRPDKDKKTESGKYAAESSGGSGYDGSRIDNMQESNEYDSQGEGGSGGIAAGESGIGGNDSRENSGEVSAVGEDGGVKSSGGAVKGNGSAEEGKVYSAQTTADTSGVGENVQSSYAIFIDLESGNILAQKDSKTIINPASMTKILTVLVAAEHIEEKDLDDTFTITREITDYSYVNDCSSAGFAENETVTVRDLFYGTILPSGADAAAGLAIYVAGSLDAFVDMMNDKLEELGLSRTAHFTNCVGIYDQNHYCTLYDMAMIMEAAIDNELCREVMTAHTYTTSETPEHPEGIIISNWFLRRIEDKDTGGEVICAKTGYVVQSGSCAASYGVDKSGKEYICVTADAHSPWRCIYDHVELYKRFAVE